MVSYTYDAWGKPLATTGTLSTTLGTDNPFRYRGYYYDAETGLYYLKSRYYDPDTCRFLNGDVLMSTGQGVIGYNMYGYCGNNPIVKIDNGGHEAELVSGLFGGSSGETLTNFSKYLSILLGISAADGPLPFGDLVALIAVVGAAVIGGAWAIQQRSFARAREREKTKENDITNTVPPRGPHRYWIPLRVGDNILPGEGLEYSQARDWVSRGGDLLCINHAAAIAIVKFYPSAVRDPRHKGKGYLNHYHLSTAHANHIWYYGE